MTARMKVLLAVVAAGLGAMSVAGPAMAQLELRLQELEQSMAMVYDGDVVTLQQCIEVAQVGSATLGQYEEQLRSAEIDKRAAWAQWLPNLTLSGYWQRQERTDFDQTVFDPITGLPTGETADETVLQTFSGTTLRSAWTVFDGFSRLGATGRAQADLQAERATYTYQQSLLVQEVTNAYYDLVRAKLRVQVALDTEELAARELERSETYFELGISTRSDVLQQKVRHEQTKLDTVRERNSQRNAFASLAHLMNITAARPFEVVDAIPDVHAEDLPEVGDLVARAQEQRQDLQSAVYNVTGREKAVTEARSGYYPTVEVFASYAYNKSETPYRFGAQTNDQMTWGVQGQWNLFDRFQTKQQSRRSVAERRRAEYQLRQAMLDMEKEIIQIRNNLVEARERWVLSTQTVEQAQEDLRLAEERFRVGAGTSLDVINAQVNLATARRDVVDAQTDFVQFRGQLARAVGGSLR